MGKPNALHLRVIVVGSEKVGKYSLSQQFANGWIAPKSEGSTEPLKKQMQINEVKVEFQVTVCDVNDIDKEVASCDGIILVYSVVDNTSFNYLKATIFPKLHGKLALHGNDGTSGDTKIDGGDEATSKCIETPTVHPGQIRLAVPVVLVGNKADEAKLSRQVETADAEILCTELSCIAFFETAATCNSNVAKTFETLAEEILRNKETSKSSRQKKNSGQRKDCCSIL